MRADSKKKETLYVAVICLAYNIISVSCVCFIFSFSLGKKKRILKNLVLLLYQEKERFGRRWVNSTVKDVSHLFSEKRTF